MMKLKVGDKIEVVNGFGKLPLYPVTRIEGKKAFTKFRVFNINIFDKVKYLEVFEYGKSPHTTTNTYYVHRQTTRKDLKQKSVRISSIK